VKPSPLTLAYPQGGPYTEALERVSTYLRQLGLQDDQNLRMLAEGCVQRARLRVRENAGEELNRRALEEARRHHDRWLRRALSLSDQPTQQELGRARAALLLSGIAIDTDTWHHANHLAVAEQLNLRAAFPQAIPSESPLSMPEQAIEFVSLQGTDQKAALGKGPSS